MSGRRVVIVGGGVVGLSTAYYCARAGHRVVVLDDGPPRYESCSRGNAGMVVPSHVTPLASPGAVALGLRSMLDPQGPLGVRLRPDPSLLRWGRLFLRSSTAEHVDRAAPVLRGLLLAGRTCFEELAGEWDNRFGLVRRGLLMLCRTEHGLAEERHAAERAASLGVPAEPVGPDEIRRLEPGVRVEAAGGVYYPRDCHLDPGRFMDELAAACRGEGVEVRHGLKAAGWESGGGEVRAVRTEAGPVEGEVFVAAGGVWTAPLLRPLGIRLPMAGGKGYAVTLDSPPRLPELCAILVEARVAVTPMGSRLRFAGTMEITAPDLTVRSARVEGMLRAIPGYLPDFPVNLLAGRPVWTGLRPCTPDGLPYLGSFAAWPNLYAAAGHAMLGLSLGPISGRLLAERISGREPAIDLAPLSPDRFGGTGRDRGG